MPQYAVLQGHPPDNCPMTNAKVREFAMARLPKLPEMAAEKGVKILLDIHLDPGHKAFMLFESPNAELVRDLIFQSGLAHFTDSEFFLVTPIEELVRAAIDMPTLY